MNCGFLQTRNTVGQIGCKLMSQIPDSFRIQIRILINRTLSCNDQLLDLGWYVGKLTSQLNSSRHLKNFPADFYIHREKRKKRCLWIKSKFFAENVSTVLIPFEQISRYTLYPKLSPPDMEFTIQTAINFRPLAKNSKQDETARVSKQDEKLRPKRRKGCIRATGEHFDKKINGCRKIHINFTHLRYPVGCPGILLPIIAILILNNIQYTVSRQRSTTPINH